jgi:DNA invertase Pin-like site-specific DNA recombinase
MKKAILYTRIFNTQSSVQEESLASQEHRLRLFCQKEQIQVVKVYTELKDADDLERTEFNLLLDEFLCGKVRADLLLFTSADKLSTNLHHLRLLHFGPKELGLTPKGIDPVNVCHILIFNKS